MAAREHTLMYSSASVVSLSAGLQAVERTKQRLQAAALEKQHLEADLAAAQQRQQEGAGSQQQPTVQMH
jgi:hypothetical protein